MADERPTRRRPGRGVSPGIGAVVIVVALLVVIGGYGAHWRWIGVNGRTATLWDWLNLVLLPIAALVMSLWLRHRPTLTATWAAAVAVGVVAFAVLVAAGYLVPWAWTGFEGNTLWDWLNLAALPLAVALIPVLLERRSGPGATYPDRPTHPARPTDPARPTGAARPPGLPRRHAAALALGAAVFLALVLAGYLAHWRWTGFTGNTAWDWLHLLLLPLLVPVVIVPLLRPMVSERFTDQPPGPPGPPEPPGRRA